MRHLPVCFFFNLYIFNWMKGKSLPVYEECRTTSIFSEMDTQSNVCQHQVVTPKCRSCVRTSLGSQWGHRGQPHRPGPWLSCCGYPHGQRHAALQPALQHSRQPACQPAYQPARLGGPCPLRLPSLPCFKAGNARWVWPPLPPPPAPIPVNVFWVLDEKAEAPVIVWPLPPEHRRCPIDL